MVGKLWGTGNLLILSHNSSTDTVKRCPSPGHVLAVHGGDVVPFLRNGGQQQHHLEVVVQIHTSGMNPSSNVQMHWFSTCGFWSTRNLALITSWRRQKSMVKWETPKVFSKLSHVACDVVPMWVWRLGDNLRQMIDFTCRSFSSHSACAACSAAVGCPGAASTGWRWALVTYPKKLVILSFQVRYSAPMKRGTRALIFFEEDMLLVILNKPNSQLLEEKQTTQKNDYTMVINDSDTMPVKPCLLNRLWAPLAF